MDVVGDLRGADVVVLAERADAAAIARSAPASVVLVAGPDAVVDRCREVLDGTLFPRARVIGIDDAARVAEAAEAIVFERDSEHEVVAMRDGAFVQARVRLGRGGIRAFLHV